MSMRVLILTFLALGVSGCGKQRQSTPGPNSAAANESPASTESNGLSAAQTAAQLSELTQAVRKYAAEQRRVPQNLEELVAKGYVSQIPFAPTGKQYVINKNLQVTLVGR